MHQSVGKITDENILLFSSQTKFALQKAAIVPFTSDNHVISLSCGRKESLNTSVPISHFKLSCYFIFLMCVMNRTVIFQAYLNT